MVPERIFSVAFHRGEKLVVAAGDKWGKVKGIYLETFVEKKISRLDYGIVRTQRVQHMECISSATTHGQ